MFLGIGQLNKTKDSFYITDIKCNNYTNSNFNLGKGYTANETSNFSGSK